jgi:hypothetical protein
VVKERLWEGLGYVPNPAQRPVHNSLTRHRVLVGGRRLGKSVAGARELEAEAAFTYANLSVYRELGKVRRFWIAGPDYSDDEKEFRILYDDLKRMDFPFDHPGTYNTPFAGSMRVSLWDGTYVVETRSAKHPESMDGEGLAGILLVEAAKLREHIWEKYLRPALADDGGWSLATSTPEGKNWLYRHWQQGQDPAWGDWDSWRVPSWANDRMFPGGEDDPEIEAMRRELSPERFAQQVAAEFTEYVGRVFKEFDEELHVRDVEYRPDLPLVGAVDYGFVNDFVWLAIQYDVFDNVYVVGEYRANMKDINEIARDLAQWPLARNSSEFYPDPAEPGESAILSKVLRSRQRLDTGGPLQWRLDLIRRHLRLDPASEGHPPSKREPKLFIDRRCVELVREMLDYRYADTREESMRAAPEAPLKKDDHGPEALGRFFRGYFGSAEATEGRGRAVVHRAVIRAGR